MGVIVERVLFKPTHISSVYCVPRVGDICEQNGEAPAQLIGEYEGRLLNSQQHYEVFNGDQVTRNSCVFVFVLRQNLTL